MAYYIAQPLGVGTGADGEALDGAWLNAEIEIHAADGGVGATYLHTLLDKPGDSASALTNATAQVATITPDVIGTLRVRTRTTTDEGVVSYVTRVIRVTQDAAGADASNGVCPTAFGELPGEANYGGNARGYVERHERNWRAVGALAGASVTLSDATPEIESGAGSAGVSTEVSRADHVHPALPAGTPYDLAPADVVFPGTSPSPGVSTEYARGDHSHYFPFEVDSDTSDSTIVLRTSGTQLIKTKGYSAIGTLGAFIGIIASGNSDGAVTYTENTIIGGGGGNLRITDGNNYVFIGTDVELFSDAGDATVKADVVLRLKGSDIVQSDPSGAFTKTTTYVAAKTETHGSDVTSVTESIAQATSGVGGTMRKRAGKGAAGSIGGQYYLGGGNGGTPGTNLGGDTHVILGTPVGGVTAKFILEREDGTGIAHLYEGSAGKAYVVTAGTAMLVGRGATTGATFDASGITLRDSLLTAFVPTTKHVASSGYEYLWTVGGASTVSTATTTTVATLPVQASQGLRVKVTVSVYNITAGTHTVVETTTPWAGRRAGAGALAETVNFVAAAAVGDADAGLGAVDVSVSSNNAIVTVVTTDANQRRICCFAEVLPANNP